MKKSMTITGWLTMINVWCFVAVVFFGPFLGISVLQFGLQPNTFLKGKCIWTLVTHIFMHENFWHLLMNMLVLSNLGIPFEVILGKKRFLCFYLISGIIAGLVFVFFAYFLGSIDLDSMAAKVFCSPTTMIIGASGAISGIAGLIVALVPKIKMQIIFCPFFVLSAYLMIPILLFGMWFVSILFNLPIGNTAHLGGFLAGIGYGIYLRWKHKEIVEILNRLKTKQ